MIINTKLVKMTRGQKKKEGENPDIEVEDEDCIKDFDDVFRYIGGWGLYQVKQLLQMSSQNCFYNQILLTLAFFPSCIFLGYVQLSPVLTLFTPPHW